MWVVGAGRWLVVVAGGGRSETKRKIIVRRATNSDLNSTEVDQLRPTLLAVVRYCRQIWTSGLDQWATVIAAGRLWQTVSSSPTVAGKLLLLGVGPRTSAFDELQRCLNVANQLPTSCFPSQVSAQHRLLVAQIGHMLATWLPDLANFWPMLANIWLVHGPSSRSAPLGGRVRHLHATVVSCLV